MEGREWYYVIGGEQHGPVAEDELRSLLAQGHVRPDDLVWTSGMGGWHAAQDIHDLWAREVVPALEAPPATPPLSELPEPAATGKIQPHPLAITSLVLALAYFVCFGPMTAIPAIICGHLALRQIRREPERYKGKEIAIAGLVIGYIVAVLMFYLWLLLILVGQEM